MCLSHGEVREQQNTSKSTGSEAEIFLACQHAGAVRTLTTRCGKDGGRQGREGGSSGQHEMLICRPRPATCTLRGSFLCEELHQLELVLVKQGGSEQEYLGQSPARSGSCTGAWPGELQAEIDVPAQLIVGTCLTMSVDLFG